ncbi:hypothetical protein HPB47_022168 [Ixodes persulcatus]|uniref:Uncharacterized protein n=1 Tax=Ixodes persulcatus TaxID=34615 RepID=A0AC60QAJ0_IXOPE|nr:hypothetical protein HPB47_022168 [Ixodes persulcatus]
MAAKRHNTRGKSCAVTSGAVQTAKRNDRGPTHELFGLPEPPICGANFSSHRDLLCGDVDMRRADSVRRTAEISRRDGGTREKSRSRSTNRSNLNEQDGSKKNHDESRRPRRTTGLPFKAASGPYPIPQHASKQADYWSSPGVYPNETDPPSPTPKHQPSVAPLLLFPIPPGADATGALPTPRKDAPAAAPPLFYTIPSMTATSAPPTQLKCGHSEYQSELSLQNYHQQCRVTELILYPNLIPLGQAPVVLLLQEAQVPNLSLPGYDRYTRPTIPHRQRTPNGSGGKAPPYSVNYRGNAAVLVAARIPHDELNLQRWCTQHQEVVGVALQLPQCKVVAVSIHVRPSIRNSVTIDWSWLENLRKMHPHALVVIGADFNTRHTYWGSRTDTYHGSNLVCAMEDNHLSLLNDPDLPTRVGQPAHQGDTTTDLTWTNRRRALFWELGADTWGATTCPSSFVWAATR